MTSIGSNYLATTSVRLQRKACALGPYPRFCEDGCEISMLQTHLRLTGAATRSPIQASSLPCKDLGRIRGRKPAGVQHATDQTGGRNVAKFAQFNRLDATQPSLLDSLHDTFLLNKMRP